MAQRDQFQPPMRHSRKCYSQGLTQLAVSAACSAIFLAACAVDPVSSSTEPDRSQSPVSLLVFTQSKGRGVPKDAQGALADIQKLLSDTGHTTDIAVWGLEGERRLCSQVDAQQHAALLQQITEIAEAIQLLRAEVVPVTESDCGSQ